MIEMSILWCTHCRLMFAKPHNADVEIIISANNLPKSIHRNRMKIETENNQLFIHYNIPDHANWNPRLAVLALLVN